MIGTQVSHYRIEAKAGDGGMGVVYQAVDTRLGRPAALKFLPSNLLKDEEARERFLREARLAATLDHANICTIYEIDELPDGRPFIAMAYYEGESLIQRLERGPLSISDAVEIAAQVARGLGHAHRQGVLHRDVKPGNILLTSRGRVKLVDFGLAKLLEDAENHSLTRSGIVLGSPAYVAPESLRDEPVDHRADLWSLGVVMHEMLAGEQAFRGAAPTAILRSVLHGEPVSLGELRPGLPPSLKRLLGKALEKDPEDRHQQATEILEDLDRVRAEIRAGWPAKPAAAKESVGLWTSLWRAAARLFRSPATRSVP